MVFRLPDIATIIFEGSFYGPPRSNVAKSWTRRVKDNPRFKFTAKLYEAFTHERKPPDLNSMIFGSSQDAPCRQSLWDKSKSEDQLHRHDHESGFGRVVDTCRGDGSELRISYVIRSLGAEPRMVKRVVEIREGRAEA